MRDPSHFTDPQRLRDQYSDSERFAVRVETHRLYNERKESFLDWIVDQLDLQSGLRLADVGCGPGNYFARLAARGAHVVGSDLSRGMAAEAQTAGFPTVVADAQSLPFATASFDRVMCNHMLYHVPDQTRAMLELRRITRPGGRVVMATNGSDHLKAFHEMTRLAAADLRFELPPRGPSPFTLEDLDRVREVFPMANVLRSDNCLVFPDPQPALDYLRSWIGATGPLEEAMRRRIATTIERDGAFRVPTIAGCFVADV
jgi:SAM-dependent methyltransferase